MRNGWAIALVVIGVLGLWLTLTSPTHSTLDRWHDAAWSLLFAVAFFGGIVYSVRAGQMASRQNARPTRRSNGWAIGLVLLGLVPHARASGLNGCVDCSWHVRPS